MKLTALCIFALTMFTIPAFGLSQASNWGQGSAQSACVTPASGHAVWLYGFSADTADNSEDTLAELQVVDGATNVFLKFMATTKAGAPVDHIVERFPNNHDSNNLPDTVSLPFPAQSGSLSDPDSTSGNGALTINSFTVTGSVNTSFGYLALTANNKVCVQFNAAATNQYESVTMYYTIH